MIEIILASASPRRQQFFKELGLQCTIHVADIDETPRPDEDPILLAHRLAESKAQAVAERTASNGREQLIIAADTVVAQDRELLGKPLDEADAARMLRQLRTGVHQVHSGVSVLQRAANGETRQETIVNSTDVVMRPYADTEIAAYVATGDPLDKAGAYAIQHPVFAPVQQINGCISGVMGLPLANLRGLLARFGVQIEAPLPPLCQFHAAFACCQIENTPTATHGGDDD
ncbi:MAG: Maf family protein [Caldilineaceae bacterium]